MSCNYDFIYGNSLTSGTLAEKFGEFPVDYVPNLQSIVNAERARLLLKEIENAQQKANDTGESQSIFVGYNHYFTMKSILNDVNDLTFVVSVKPKNKG